MDTKIELNKTLLNKTLLNILQEVRTTAHEYLYTGRGTARFDPELGICNAVGLAAPSSAPPEGCRSLLSALMAEWPEFSGDHSYPVPHPGESPDNAFYLASTKEMWSPASAYGAARLRLLDWMIAQLEANCGVLEAVFFEEP